MRSVRDAVRGVLGDRLSDSLTRPAHQKQAISRSIRIARTQPTQKIEKTKGARDHLLSLFGFVR
jgi:hypothetical protein